MQVESILERPYCDKKDAYDHTIDATLVAAVRTSGNSIISPDGCFSRLMVTRRRPARLNVQPRA